ncbi:5-(carboxyamino)imidazole ribonucleotide mutase [Limnochorda pilosa]|uniref:N5-carboxyaminoimidazole ribonucleotide mutase n=1 Tax=Limnochorda pilosa TaxID=1555112 RepID=A0A0K2SJX5_LIMPI|nr:5-(carboxyamino)imidazole ribonucleotide mutase [Limnochorda pilosa]BAS27416.1 N5-carboxyaminoimidazole ribonucleotide mutase [Limnochorda pilosa]
MAKVAIVVGSRSDLPRVERARNTLEDFGVSYELRVLSAHRTPAEVAAYGRSARERGIRVIVAAAGLAAALPGALAAETTLPVVGLPVSAGPLQGIEALLAMAQMPPGVPVGTVGIDSGTNAALQAVRILALEDAELAGRLESYQRRQRDAVLEADREVSGGAPGQPVAEEPAGQAEHER